MERKWADESRPADAASVSRRPSLVLGLQVLPPEHESSAAGLHHPSGEASRGMERLYGNAWKPSSWDGDGWILSWALESSTVHEGKPL